jgi:membrane fusion protein (multidrug efflux system)
MAANTSPVDKNNALETADIPPIVSPPKPKRWLVWLPLIVLAIMVGGYFGAQWWLYALRHVSTDDARVKGALITVSSQVPGRLLSVTVEEGQAIKKGEMLAQIQQDDYRAQVALREAALEAAKSQLEGAEAELELSRTLAEGQIERSEAVLGASRSQLAEAEKAALLEEQRMKASLREKDAAVEEAKARLAGAKANLDKAAADLERARQLLQEGIIAVERRDQATTAYDQAVSQYQSAQEALNKNVALAQVARAESQRVQLLLDNVRTQQRKVRESEALKTLAVAERLRVPMKEEAVKHLRAKVKEAEAQLELARMQLTETLITSPVDGVVSQMIADPGERVQPGQPIAIVNNPQDVWIEANIEETSIRQVHVGQPVAIDVDAYPQRTFHGTVAQLGAAARSEFAIIPAGSASAHFIKVTQRIPVRIAVENRDGLLKPGMMVVVGIRVK